MEHSSSFLDKYKKLIPPEGVVQDALVAAVHEVLHVRIAKKGISVRGTTVFLTTSSVLKSEIMLHKEHVLKNMQKQLAISGRTITEIR